MMAFEAAARALAVANVHPMQVDMIIVATSTPAHMFPSTASQVQDYLGPAGPVRSTSARPAPALCMRSAWPPILSQAGRRKMWLLLGPKRCRVCWIGRIEAPVSFWRQGQGRGPEGLSIPGGILASTLGSDGSGGDLLQPAGGIS